VDARLRSLPSPAVDRPRAEIDVADSQLDELVRAKPVEGRVIGVSDGNTLTVLADAKIQRRIRLSGIDAPEKGQAFGERSKQNLSSLMLQKRVEARCHKKDRYGREVCTVFVNLCDVGLEQIRVGMACNGL